MRNIIINTIINITPCNVTICTAEFPGNCGLSFLE